MAYKVKIHSIVNDGTTLYINASISDGPTTTPMITPSFASQTDPAEIDAYFQAIADSQPTLALALHPLVGKTYTQA